MNLRVHYLDENSEPATHDYWVSLSRDELRGHLDRVAELVSGKGMISYWNGSDYLFSVPASRILKIEARP